MYTYIYLRINDNKCPEKKQIGPFADGIFKGKIEKSRQSEVISGVGWGETGALWPVIEQESYTIAQFWVIARPDANDVLFYDIAADEIRKYCGTGCETDPPPHMLFIIHQDKNDQKQVKWVP